jgi:hypothetical protein
MEGRFLAKSSMPDTLLAGKPHALTLVEAPPEAHPTLGAQAPTKKGLAGFECSA